MSDPKLANNQTYLAAAIRDIVADPTPAGLRALSVIACQVERMERALDEQVSNARFEQVAIWSLDLAKLA